MTKILLHILLVTVLTILTQVGGVIWILVLGYFKWSSTQKSKKFRLLTFLILYLLISLTIIPPLARINGRVPLPIIRSSNLVTHNMMTPLMNRHYVKPQLKAQLMDLANKLNAENPNIKLSYLDANFPFIDGFPLLPHLSHDDGHKVDLSFYYTKDGKQGNLKPSQSGYGKYVEPDKKEFNQTHTYKARGHWHYDFTKYLTLGSRDDLEFDPTTTKKLIKLLVNQKLTEKILIEPHLKKRMNLSHSKIRFQGCHAVRHDDHIHLQIR